MKTAAIIAIIGFFAFAEAGNLTTEAPPVHPPMANTTADLINLNVIQMEREIDAAQAQMDLLQTRYDEKLNVVNQNHQLLEDEIIRLNEKLDLWISESSYKKLCVEKYRNEITTPKIVQVTIQNCVNVGKGKSAGLITNTKTYLTNAISRKTNFIANANSCIKNQAGVYNQTVCLTNQIEYWRGYFKGDLLNLSNELEAQLCLSNSYTKLAQQCVSTYISGVFGTMNKASYKIQSCFEGKDQSTPCVYSGGIITALV